MYGLPNLGQPEPARQHAQQGRQGRQQVVAEGPGLGKAAVEQDGEVPQLLGDLVGDDRQARGNAQGL
jgi:hypothetical protein